MEVSKKSISPTEKTISARKAVALLSFARGELMEEYQESKKKKF